MKWYQKLFQFFYSIIDLSLDEGFNYERLVWTFNPYQFGDPNILPQVWLRKEALVLQMFSSKMHILVIGPPGIGKTSITDFLFNIGFPIERASLVGGESGAVTTAAGLRESVIRLADLIVKEFNLDSSGKSVKNIPKAILHLEEFLRSPRYIRDVLKPIMSDFKLIIKQSHKSGRTGEWLAPVNIYADTNPPLMDSWVSPDFHAKRQQLEEFIKESAYIRRFTVVMALDNYSPEQNAIIRKWKEFIRVNPHDALESGEFFKKYEDFVRKHRKIKVKYTPVPEDNNLDIHKFILGMEELQNRGKLLLPIIYTDYIDNVYAIAESFARIHGHKEIEMEDWKMTKEFLERVFETLTDEKKSSKRSLYARAVELGSRKEDELEAMRDKVEEKYNIT